MSEITKVDTSLYKLLNTGSIIKLANRLMLLMNKTIANHNERTTYIAMKIVQHHPMSDRCSTKNLVFLSLFHTIGFFREEASYDSDPDQKHIIYFSQNKSVVSKYVFGCYYLEYMTPIKMDARALEDFNQPYNKDLKKNIYIRKNINLFYILLHELVIL